LKTDKTLNLDMVLRCWTSGICGGLSGKAG